MLCDPCLLSLNTYKLVYTLNLFSGFLSKSTCQPLKTSTEAHVASEEPPNSLTASMQRLKWASSKQRTRDKK